MPILRDLGDWGKTIFAMMARAAAAGDFDLAPFDEKLAELDVIKDEIRAGLEALMAQPAPEAPAPEAPPSADLPAPEAGPAEVITPEPPPDAAPVPAPAPAPESVAPEPAPEPEPVPDPAPVAEDPAPRTRRGPK